MERQGGWDKLSETVQNRFKSLARRVKVSKVIKLAANSVLSMGLPKIDEVLGSLLAASRREQARPHRLQ